MIHVKPGENVHVVLYVLASYVVFVLSVTKALLFDVILSLFAQFVIFIWIFPAEKPIALYAFSIFLHVTFLYASQEIYALTWKESRRKGLLRGLLYGYQFAFLDFKAVSQ